MSVPRILLAASLSVGLVACGEGDPSDSAAKDDPFKTSAEAACADFNAVVPDEPPKYTDVSQAIAQANVVLAQYEKTLGTLSGLTYPSESPGEELRRILVVENQRQFEETRSATRQLEEAVASKNNAQFSEAADRFAALGKSPGADSKGVLNAYGLKQCDQAFGPKQ